MVEIKPYIEDDEGGDDDNWIPLFPNQSTEQSDSVAAAAKNIIVDSSDVEGSSKSGPPTVESEDDDDEGWQKLSTSRVISTEHQSQAVAAPTVSSLMDFIPTLSSITKVTTVIPTSDEIDDADSESDENIKWRRPNALDDTEIKDFRREKNVSNIFEEYDDDKISSMKIDENEYQQRSIPIKSDHIAKEEDNTSSSSSIDKEPITIRKQQESEHTQQSSPLVQEQQQRQQYQQRPPPSTRIKSKLQEKFIHDPLRSLPFHFLHNFFLEAKYQLTFAWKCYFLNEDNGENGSNEATLDTSALAAMILYFIVGLFALGLIWSGIYDIGLVMLSTLISSMETSVKTSCDGMRASIYTTLILGTVIWLMSRLKSREWFEATFRFPTLSNVIPVVVAVTSPSMYEIFVIGFSIQVILSVCMTGLTGVGCPPGMPTVVVVVIAAAISVFLVMNMVSWSELEKEGDNDSAERKLHLSRNSFFGKQIHRVMTHCHECHALGIVTLAGLSIALVILRDGSSLRVLRIVLSIGIGIFVLERLWDSILEAIAIKSDRRTARGMSWRHISRRAMKQSLLDLSKSALWSKDDAGNVVLGILSEEDSELRYAILGWILNRWSATSNDQPAEKWGGTATADDQSADENSPLNEASSSPDEKKKTSKSSHSESVPGARSDDEKVDMKDGNNDSYNTEEFRVHCESDFRNNDCRQSSNSSYQSLQSVIARLDADETLIPAIDRYREWVYSLRPNPNLAFCVAVWKQCPAMFIFGVAFVWYVWTSFLQVILFYTLGSTSRGNIGNFESISIIVGVLWPLLLMEYFSLSRWWKTHFKDREDIPDSVMILLESEDLSPKLFFYPIALATDSSTLFLRVWNLLLESISFLESSVPAVRCATVAACTADLAADTLCLVDLVLEVQKRGVVGGVGMLIWDAFNHHLKEELQQRRSNEEGVGTGTNQDEELDSKYTGAVINSARNLGKISQNIGGLMNSKKDFDDMQEKEASMKSDDNSERGRSVEEISKGKDDKAQEVSNEERELGSTNDDDHDDEGVATHEVSSSQSEDDNTRQEIKKPSQEVESGVKIEQKEDGKNLIPILVGGGLAVVGAFIGGVTVAAANKKNDEKRRPRDSGGS